MEFEIGQMVLSPKVGAVSSFEGKIVSIVENYKNERFAVVVDKLGRSFHRDLHELKEVETAA